jgi:hypothetical protein
MDKIKSLLNVACYKKTGFYFSLASIIISVIAMIVYGTGFSSENLSQYHSSMVIILLLIGILVFVAMDLFNVTSKYAPWVLWGFSLAAFLVFIATAYMYVTGVFYNGFSFEALSLMEPAYLWSIILLLVNSIISNVAIYLPQGNQAKQTEAAHE